MKHLAFIIAFLNISSAYALTNSAASTNQSQSQYNDTTQSPTMLMSGSNAVTNITSDMDSYVGAAVSADGSFNFDGRCPTNTFFMSTTGGYNEAEVSGYRGNSHGQSVGISAGVVIPFGGALDHCEEQQRLASKVAKVAYSKLLITTCLTFAKSKVDLEQLATLEPEYKACPEIVEKAMNGWYGMERERIAREAVTQYKLEREANMRKVGIDPTKESLVYMK